MANERNMIFTVLLQYYDGFFILYLILVPQFLFMGMLHYFSTLIEDTKQVVQRFNFKFPMELVNNFIEMIDLHQKSLRWVIIFFHLISINFTLFYFLSSLINNYGRIMSAPIFILNTFSMICLCTNLFDIKGVNFFSKKKKIEF